MPPGSLIHIGEHLAAEVGGDLPRHAGHLSVQRQGDEDAPRHHHGVHASRPDHRHLRQEFSLQARARLALGLSRGVLLAMFAISAVMLIFFQE